MTARPPAAAVNHALRVLAESLANAPGHKTRKNSALEVFLIGRLAAMLDEECDIPLWNRLVEEAFAILPEHPRGRRQLFLGKWLDTENSGRKTVWNQSSRRSPVATALVNSGADGTPSPAAGLRADALEQLATLIEGAEVDRTALAVVLCRDHAFPTAPTPDQCTDLLAQRYGLGRGEVERFTVDLNIDWDRFFQGPGWSPDRLEPGLAPPQARNVDEEEVAAVILPEVVEEELPPNAGVPVDPLVRRVVRANKAVVFTGPPGTGKSLHAMSVLALAASDPEALGLSEPAAGGLVATPDESWSAQNLLSGERLSGGELVYEEGFLLQAIRQNRWLVLDELNRADMDRIFGGVFTWLTAREVTIGFASTVDFGRVPVKLGWAHDPPCRVEEPSAASGSRRYLAGTDWRLLATYNEVDVQRVFKLGQALTRRFARVPVPPLEQAEFEELVQTRYQSLPAEAVDLIADLYASHLLHMPLGHAMFLDIARYVAVNIDMGEVSTRTLVREGYAVNIASFLNYVPEDKRQEIGRDATAREGGLRETDWQWIDEQRRHV